MKKVVYFLLVAFIFVAVAALPLHSAEAGQGLYAFYEHVFSLDEKKLYDYLVNGLSDYISMFPDSENTANACYLLAKTFHAKGDEYEALGACLQTLYLYPGYALRQECIGYAKSIVTTERAFRSEEEKYTQLIEQSVQGINRADRYYSYLEILMNLSEDKFVDWTLRATREFTNQFSQDSRLDNVMKWTADLYLKKGDEWEAYASYLKLDYTHPDSPLLPEIRLTRAKLLYEELGANEEAVKTLQDIVATWPTHEYAPEALYLTGMVYEEKIRDYEQAITAYRKLVDTFPDYPKSVTALLAIGELNQRRLEKYTEAIAAYNEFVAKYRTSPQGVEALTKVAELYERELKDYTKAAEYYAQVALYYPTYKDAPDMLIKAGDICEDKLGDYKRAISYYQMLLNTFPEHKKARNAQKRIDKAKENMADN